MDKVILTILGFVSLGLFLWTAFSYSVHLEGNLRVVFLSTNIIGAVAAALCGCRGILELD